MGDSEGDWAEQEKKNILYFLISNFWKSVFYSNLQLEERCIFSNVNFIFTVVSILTDLIQFIDYSTRYFVTLNLN